MLVLSMARRFRLFLNLKREVKAFVPFSHKSFLGHETSSRFLFSNLSIKLHSAADWGNNKTFLFFLIYAWRHLRSLSSFLLLLLKWFRITRGKRAVEINNWFIQSETTTMEQREAQQLIQQQLLLKQRRFLDGSGNISCSIIRFIF